MISWSARDATLAESNARRRSVAVGAPAAAPGRDAFLAERKCDDLSGNHRRRRARRASPARRCSPAPTTWRRARRRVSVRRTEWAWPTIPADGRSTSPGSVTAVRRRSATRCCRPALPLLVGVGLLLGERAQANWRPATARRSRRTPDGLASSAVSRRSSRSGVAGRDSTATSPVRCGSLDGETGWPIRSTRPASPSSRRPSPGQRRTDRPGRDRVMPPRTPRASPWSTHVVAGAPLQPTSVADAPSPRPRRSRDTLPMAGADPASGWHQCAADLAPGRGARSDVLVVEAIDAGAHPRDGARSSHAPRCQPCTSCSGDRDVDAAHAGSCSPERSERARAGRSTSQARVIAVAVEDGRRRRARCASPSAQRRLLPVGVVERVEVRAEVGVLGVVQRLEVGRYSHSIVPGGFDVMS